jgi:thiol-disulfide isomerase/thioredoxin
MPFTNRTRSIATLSTLILAGSALGLGTLAAPGVEREGNAEHVNAMIELECKPFDTTLFDGLTNWSLASTIDASAIENKVVLISMVDSGNPKSLLTLSTLARYERQNADDGLVTLAVHPELGWEAMQEKIDDGRVKVLTAMDPGNAFATALGSDDAPDLYLIDRAGQLRYADLESRSLKRAVGQLLRETQEEAIANAKLQSEGVEIADTSDSKEETKSEPKAITSEAYASADWPQQNQAKFKAKNFQGQPLPVPLGNEEWLSDKKDTENKVIVLDFWATWCGPCRAASPMLEEIQREFEGKLEVLAIGGSNDDERSHKRYVFSSKKAYSNLYDKNDSIYRPMGITAIPHTVVMSTDGIIRWQGNPLSKDFKDIVTQIVEVDPMFAEGED